MSCSAVDSPSWFSAYFKWQRGTKLIASTFRWETRTCMRSVATKPWGGREGSVGGRERQGATHLGDPGAGGGGKRVFVLSVQVLGPSGFLPRETG